MSQSQLKSDDSIFYRVDSGVLNKHVFNMRNLEGIKKVHVCKGDSPHIGEELTTLGCDTGKSNQLIGLCEAVDVLHIAVDWLIFSWEH